MAHSSRKPRVTRVPRLFRPVSQLLVFLRRLPRYWRDARQSTALPLTLDPWDNRPPLPNLDGCTPEQREAIQMALCYGVVSHSLLLRTARGAHVQLYVSTVAGLGRKRRCPATPEYRLGMERYLRVEGRRRVLCECPLGQQGQPCAHAGATWLAVLR